MCGPGALVCLDSVGQRGPNDSVPGYRGSMNRITVNPDVMGGVPCLRGLRIPVATVVDMVAGGLTVQQIVDELPPLEADDVAAALRFAADAVSDREIVLQATA